ncbi:hypothetical protein GCM10022207_65680 [Streptomyces lannensis]|uniref:Uncharacterized protein n=1 Tax=Streptomyces lannensis TaxID=766498 RepID=A0ABP7KX05_9ACTN
MAIGKFHGVISPTTPTGSRRVWTIVVRSSPRTKLGLADHSLHRAVPDHRPREPAVQPQVDPAFADQVVGNPLPAVGVEGDGIADRLGVGVGVEVEGAPEVLARWAVRSGMTMRR